MTRSECVILFGGARKPAHILFSVAGDVHIGINYGKDGPPRGTLSPQLALDA